MKAIFALALICGLTISNSAKASDNFAHAVEVLKLAANGEYGGDCKLNVQDTKNNSLLVSVEDAKGMMYATLNENNVQILKETVSKNGTEHYLFKVGQSTLIEVLHNSDAFDKTTIKRGNDKVSCKNDY